MNKTTRHFWVYSIIIILTTTSVFAGNEQGGLPGAFLRIPINARANGMGSAFSAIVQDPTATWWNPAGLAYIPNFQLAGMYSIMTMDRFHNFAGLAIPLGEPGTIGLNWLQFGVSKIDGRDETGQPTGTFDDNEMAIGATYAFQLSNFMSFGVSGKYLHHTLAHQKATGFAMDLGFMFNFKNAIRFAFVMQNLSGNLKWNTESNLKEKIPVVYRSGIGIMPAPFPLLITVDVAKIKGIKGVDWYAGSELWLFNDILAIRGGYAATDFTAGASLLWHKRANSFLQFDYAFIPDILGEGATNQVSFVIGF